MANFLLKVDTLTTASITLNRKTIGFIRKTDTGWAGSITYEGVTLKVTEFSGRSNCFYALTQAAKVGNFNRRYNKALTFCIKGSTDAEEIRVHGETVRAYVAAVNAAEGQTVLRVVNKRRR